MSFSFIDLPWLPPAPADFSAKCRAVPADDAGHVLQQLAAHRLSSREALAFHRALKKCLGTDASMAPLSRLSLALLSNGTADFIADEIPAAAARHGVAVEIIQPDFDQVMQVAMDPDSDVNRGRPDAALIAVDHRWFGFDAAMDTGEQVFEQGLELLFAAADALKKNCGASIIYQTLAAPGPTLFGSYERRVSTTLLALIDAANARLVEHAAATGSYLLDVAHLADRIGLDTWFDPTQWAAYKVPFSARCNGAYADLLGRLLGAIRGKARKCLVLDLDNTIWGGVVGDDGIAGLTIGAGSALGEAFLEIQKTALALRNRGIVLAVASKNDHGVAMKVLEEHPEVLIRPDHVAVFQANWSDKPSNLEAIATSLSIGLDALVLLDDNPAERAQVRAALPAVAVPELPSDPAWFPWFLASAGYFEAVTYSAEDRTRADSYAANARRAEVQSSARDLGDYLSSLGMTLSVLEFDEAGRMRVAQLINKTNQFNLTTRRYTEQEIAEIESRPDRLGLQVRLSDRFGDLGMIGVIICHMAETTGECRSAHIDTWLMSCRVLGRKVEEGMLTALAAALRARGVDKITAEYRATAKNHMVRDLYDRLGFRLAKEDECGSRFYDARISSLANFDLPFDLQLHYAGEAASID